ncbi:alanine acetyltransferase [Alkalihalobacillus alcalophilus ATCC 27647 = CGMCC 1.3604]|uniref:Alanine acetyltransferase n=1 Tax=Alkalihalobacillus alcalophilus ATCC 27647 = CGMCC 1.3604 TaxID=1218173 RepID=A0A094WND9_ALKAL|nr:GNAT family N-acetyltransferase [Alkalihalobacillus alcalophilus]KGA98351.1 alanine acetyltransferase [Alkalihalobacillus alcalophilus ATCC 27647 = CGMCC 1.3604]MED1563651.1 GNAT family N-acetyltransferase [Alkalihalobacillus alcalophilus]THG91617.1 alanine acetyltransferase [Alkalihalobacillus alcalophilus ATCC 27647 = CGMCC 1.3604]
MKIRPYQETDRTFILKLSSRFSDFKLMSYRDEEQMKRVQFEIARQSLEPRSTQTEIFVAEENNGELMGYIELGSSEDYFTGKVQGYVSSVAVSTQGEGKGVGKKLMNTAEEWAKDKGFKQIVLDVFTGNERAVQFYEHLQYEAEIVKMVKQLPE